MEGTKHDTGKVPVGLISYISIIEEAKVLAFGAKKYDAWNWSKGMAWSRLYDAALRHILAWGNGEELDPESGLSHLAHAKCCISFLIDYQHNHLGTDDRRYTHTSQV